MNRNTTLLTSALVVAATSVLYSQDAASPSDDNVFTGKIPAAFKDGKVLADLRLRYEHADQDGLLKSNLVSHRTRLGFQTAPVHGFQALVEFEDVRSLTDDDKVRFPGTPPGRTVIADPDTTELNQAILSYAGYDSSIKLGRQRIKLDNDRFIGNVGWRQNEQTYDAVTLSNTSLPDTKLFYGYIDNVNRIFGDISGTGFSDFESESHLINASYSGLSIGTLTGYAYVLDLQNDVGGDPSSNTYGVSLAGGYPINDDWKLNYRAEYAYQTDGGDNPSDYDANYYHLNLGAAYQKFNFGAGYEVLGDDDPTTGGTEFATPLATLHAFNGWADTFLATPMDGLEDLYFFAGCTLPYNIPLRVVYHQFDAEASGGNDYGSEIDVVVSKKFGTHWGVLAKYAHYNGDFAGIPDTDKFWLQLEFKF